MLLHIRVRVEGDLRIAQETGHLDPGGHPFLLVLGTDFYTGVIEWPAGEVEPPHPYP